MIVNQWVPAAHRGDAIGDSARRVRTLLRAMGHEAELFALDVDDDLKHEVRTFADPAGVTNWGAIFAMATLALVPVFAVFIFFQRYLVAGISTSGLSGR